jgi:penicillin-binding protein 1A
MRKFIWYTFLGLFSLGCLGVIGVIAGAAGVVNYYGRDLPDYESLKDYNPPMVTRLYAGDGRLMAEFAQERRAFVPGDEIPDLVKHAFIAAEDQNFYRHKGVDPVAILRAAALNFMHMGSGNRLKGASTITQQVAKNFFLTNEVSFKRKIREAILAYRMEQAMTKDRLLELYLNQIFLGSHSYGVAAAALGYFNKSLDELTVAEVAYLAALPKAPNNYHPVRNKDAATARRNYVIDRMFEDGYITKEQSQAGIKTPLETVSRDPGAIVNAPFFAEEVRRELVDRYGKDVLYTGGLAARTTIDPALQDIALNTLRNGLQNYDRRHGYRGAHARFDTMGDWRDQLSSTPRPIEMPDQWKLAAVLGAGKNAADIGFTDGTKGTITLENLKWARKYLNEGYAQGPEITAASDAVQKGDIVMVEAIAGAPKNYALRQVPLIQGALVAIDPHTGRVLAMQGGWKYKYGSSEYNRATQAMRQPGSAFKPFIYAAGLEHGFTPSSLILDAPFMIQDRPGHFWSPTNYKGGFSGPMTLRVALEKSKNLVTVRLAHHLGMDMIADYAGRFGVVDDMPHHLSGALGAIETTLMRLTSAYAVFVNGGKKIDPSIIDRIQDRRGKTIFRHDERVCNGCGPLIKWEGQAAPEPPDTRAQIMDPRAAYQMVHILEGVVERGTATALKSLNRPLAGKTGTTNESRDVWFVGFSPDLVVGVFMGFDDPRSLGKRETGGSVAVPVFKEFMEAALKDSLPTPFRVPPGIKNIRINPRNGRLAEFNDDNVIWEAYIAGTEPSEDGEVSILDGSGMSGPPVPNETFGTGNLEPYTDEGAINETTLENQTQPLSGQNIRDYTQPESRPEFTPPPVSSPTDPPAEIGTGGGTGGIY